MGWGGGCGTAEELYIFGPRCYKHRFTRQSAEKTTFPNKITRQRLEDKQSPPRRCRAARAQDVVLRAVCFLAAGSQRRSRRSVKKKKKKPSRTTKPALLWKCRLSRRHLCIRSAIRIHIARRNDADFQSAAGCRAAPAPASGGLGRCIKQALELSQ